MFYVVHGASAGQCVHKSSWAQGKEYGATWCIFVLLVFFGAGVQAIPRPAGLFHILAFILS